MTAHIAGVLLEQRGADLAQKQQHLELLSTMICEVYALDSSVARTLKIVQRRGVEGAAFEIDLTRVIATQCTDEITAAARRLMANEAAPGELRCRMQEIAALSPYVPIGILDSKTRIAEHVVATCSPDL